MQLHKRTVRTSLVGAVVVAAAAAGGFVALSGSAQAEPEQRTSQRQVEQRDEARGEQRGEPGSGQRETADVAFLEPGDLPTVSSEWTADPVADGLPETSLTCLDGELPNETSQHRAFRTELDAQAHQVIVRAADEDTAEEVLTRVETALEKCPETLGQRNPDGAFTGEDFGAVEAGDGAHVYGLESEFATNGSLDAHLFGVGRDGATVTVTVFGQLGHLSDAPVDGFKKTTGTSVDKLAG